MASAVYLPGTAGATIGDETVALVREAMGDTTRTITMASGLVGYELETPAKVIVPVVTPLVNMLPRRRGNGTDIVHWKALVVADIQDCSMPPAGMGTRLTAAENATILAWLACDAPNN